MHLTFLMKKQRNKFHLKPPPTWAKIDSIKFQGKILPRQIQNYYSGTYIWSHNNDSKSLCKIGINID